MASACQCESTLQHWHEGAYRAVKCVEKMIPIIHWQAEPAPGQPGMFLIQLLLTRVHTGTQTPSRTCRHHHDTNVPRGALANKLDFDNLLIAISEPESGPGSVYTDLEIRLEWPL